MQAAATRISADYQVPMLAHATMEPQNCTAQFKDGVATLWCATQAPPMARSAVASALKIDERHVQLHIPYLGGGFGDAISRMSSSRRRCWPAKPAARRCSCCGPASRT